MRVGSSLDDDVKVMTVKLGTQSVHKSAARSRQRMLQVAVPLEYINVRVHTAAPSPSFDHCTHDSAQPSLASIGQFSDGTGTAPRPPTGLCLFAAAHRSDLSSSQACSWFRHSC